MGIAIPLAIAAGGALASYIGGNMSAEAKQRAIDKAKDLREALAQQIEKGWVEPKYSTEPLTFEEFKFLEEYNPEFATFIAEQAPQMVREAGSQQAKQAEREALEGLQTLSRTGETAIGRAQREMGAAQAESVGTAMRQQALQELAKSGQLRGGDRMLMETAAADEAAKRARESGLQAAAMEEQRRQQALGQVGSLASQMRQEEMAKERTNVDIANSFNQRLTMRRQAHLDNIAQQRNQAQAMNQQVRREVAQKNTELRNYMKRLERERADQIERERAANANQKLLATTGMRGGQQFDDDSPEGRALAAGGNVAMQAGLQYGMNKAFGDETPPKKDGIV